MKSFAIVILKLLLVCCSPLATNATDQHCDKLLDQHNQFKALCTPDIMTPKSCCDLADLPLSKAPSAVYQITANCSCGSPFTAAVDVYCDMDTTDGGWMVIQRNKRDGKRTFYKTWKKFEEGFGDLNGDKMWYGLKPLSCFTETGQWELWIDFQFENKTWSHLHYQQFKVGSTSAEYPLTIGGFTGITPDDPFATQSLNGWRFSTFDNDNDQYHGGNCGAIYGGWWHRYCTYFNANTKEPHAHFNSTIYKLLSIEMKIRRHDCIS